MDSSETESAWLTGGFYIGMQNAGIHINPIPPTMNRLHAEQKGTSVSYWLVITHIIRCAMKQVAQLLYTPTQALKAHPHIHTQP